MLQDSTMVIPETGTDKRFPNDAVLIRDANNVLQRVVSAHGPTLWLSADYSRAMAQKSSNARRVKAKQERQTKQGDSAATVRKDSLSRVVKKHELDPQNLPPAVRTAIDVLMVNAQFQALRTDNLTIQDYFHGYLAGAHAVLAILGGAMGYDTSFVLQEDNNDKPG